MSKHLLLIMIFLNIFGIRAFPQQVANEKSGRVGTWKGDVSLNYGTNFEYLGYDGHKWTSYKAGGEASIGYSTSKFNIEASGNLNYSYRTYVVTGMTLKTVKDTALDINFTTKEVQNIRNGASLKGGWKLTSSDRLTFSYVYKFEHNIYSNGGANISARQEADTASLKSLTGTKEAVDNTVGRQTVNLNYSHQFLKAGRTLDAGYEFSFMNDTRMSDWTKYDYHIDEAVEESGEPVIYETTRYYRIMPHLFEYVNRLKVQYSEKQFADVGNLDMDFTLEGMIDTNRDHQRAATLNGTEWKDSTDYHEDFLFNAITLSPKIHGKYTVGVYTIDASYTPQYYTRKLDGDAYSGSFDYGFISHLVNLQNRFSFIKGHSLALIYDRKVKRPTYIQICPFPRDGSQYSNVKYQGDPNLMPEAFHNLNLSYSFIRKRFSVTTGIGWEYKFRIIEQTYYNSSEDDVTTRIYTWINGGHSHTNNVTLVLGWNGSSLQVHLGGKLNFFYGETNSGNTTYSSDYSMNGDISYKLKTWLFLLNGRYSSKVIRSYSRVNEVVKCDLRVQKTFGNFTVYIEGLDLLDRPYEISTVNEDQTEERYEMISNMNRLYQIGASFKF